MAECIAREAALNRLCQENCGHDYTGDCPYGCYTAAFIKGVQTIDAIPRDVLLKRIFPLGIPRTREDWNYSINARAVYAAIMKED